MLSFASICPHPPLLIPEIGKENLKKVSTTIKALEILNKDFVQVQPNVIIIVSPHSPVMPNSFAVSSSSGLSGDFSQFGEYKEVVNFKNDPDLISQILKTCRKEHIPLISLNNPKLDYGILVPLYYLARNLSNIRLVPLSFSFLNYPSHFCFGRILQKVIKKANKRIAFIASGDLSHALTIEAPCGFNPAGRKLDRKLVSLLKKRDVKGILSLDPGLIEEAGECGFRSIIILLGVLEGLDYKVEVLSYEGPFGVGYLVARFIF